MQGCKRMASGVNCWQSAFSASRRLVTSSSGESPLTISCAIIIPRRYAGNFENTSVETLMLISHLHKLTSRVEGNVIRSPDNGFGIGFLERGKPHLRREGVEGRQGAEDAHHHHIGS